MQRPDIKAAQSPAAGTTAAPPEASPTPDAGLNGGNANRDLRPDRGVTLRVVILSLVLAAFFGYIIPIIDFKLFNTFLGAMHLPPGAVGVLLMLVLVVNPLLRLVARKWGLTRNESLTVYITCLFSSTVPGHGSEVFVISNLLAPFYYATRENKYLNFLQPHLQPWFTPALDAEGKYNQAVVEGWYVGINDAPIPWGAWLLPLAFWITFVLISYAMLGCLSVILRKQWAEREALAFPLLRLPLQMTEDLDRDDKFGSVSRFFRNPVMWTGFGIAVFIQALRGLNLYFPDVPNFPLEVAAGALFTEPPWNQMQSIQIIVLPMVVGIAYMLTAEVSFSLWFFVWFMNFQLIGAYLLGFVPDAMPPGDTVVPNKVFTGYQIYGAYLAYVTLVLWAGREHFKHVARRAFGREKAGEGEKEEALSYPLAFWGFVLSFAAMVAFTCFAGVRVDIALVLWISYLVICIGLTRLAVEGGVLALQHAMLPLGIFAKLLGSGPSRWLTPENGLVPAAIFQNAFIFHPRAFVMPSFIHSFKLAHDRRIAVKPLALLIVVVILIAMSMSWWSVIRLGYENGALQLGHKWFTNQGGIFGMKFMDRMVKGGTETMSHKWIWTSVGAVLTIAMMVARSRLLWFPLHPIGYLMALVYPGRYFWTSIFLGWSAKVIIMRYGGVDAYRNILPGFLGLILGDILMILVWLIVDGWQGRVGHQLIPSMAN